MHDYLRAIGFSSIIRRKDMEKLIKHIKDFPDERFITPIASDCSLVQINKSFGSQIGITIIGEYDEDDLFYIDNCFPYCKGNYVSSEGSINMKKISDREAYEAFCDDLNIGCPLIFFLQNISDYVRSCWSNVSNQNITDVRLGGLSVEGTVLLGNRKNTFIDYLNLRVQKAQRNEMILSARSGDTDAIDNLTLDDMDTYTLIAKRLEKEDILSIVETSFIPYGVECDQYSIIGVIMSVHLEINKFTNENYWLLSVNCNDIPIDICINTKDLLGEPIVGRRFKGVIWLQGYISV